MHGIREAITSGSQQPGSSRLMERRGLKVGSTPALSTIAPESGQDGGHDQVANTINSGMRIVSLEQTKSRSAVNKWGLGRLMLNDLG